MDDPYPETFFLFIFQFITSPWIFYTVNALVLIVLLFLSGLVSGSEVAYFSLNANQISQFKQSKDPIESRIFNLIKNPRRLLANILILNNLINVAIVTLSTFLTWEIFGAEAEEGEIVATLTIVVTVAIIFFGEVLPKVYANQNNVAFAKRTSLILSFAHYILRPLTYILMNFSKIIEKRIEKKGYTISVDELNQALEITTEKEATDEEKDILKGIVNFGTLSVKQIMKSRLDITAFDIELDFHELMDKINKTGYSRIPIYKETIDKIEGILYIKDMLPFIEKDENFKWQKLLRQGYFVPESKKIDDLLKDFQEKRVHMAIIVDEYGGTSGLITMEDIIEEIVGEINDEFDEDEIAFNKLDENTFVFEGKTTLNDFCKIIGEDPGIFEEVKGESESLGGLILEINNKLPRAGDKIRYHRFLFTVVAVDNKRIKRVRVLIQALPVTKTNKA